MTEAGNARFDVLIIGGGPAGISAAVRAAESGMRVGLVDDNRNLGGQIWRTEAGGGPVADALAWLERLESARVTTQCGWRVFGQPRDGILHAEGMDGFYEFEYGKLILATGARERFLPFPGWTLPNVMGAGGLQAMVKSGLPIRAKRVIVAGTGPLLLAVAAYLRRHGAEIPMVCEQASWHALLRFGIGLTSRPGKLAQAFNLRKQLAGVAVATNSWPLSAQGGETLESVTVRRRGRTKTVACDYLACGFHLVPNVELAVLLGCKIEGGYVQVDEFQRTTAPGIFCAGEPVAIGGVDLAVVEGQIAGLAAAGRLAEARALFSKRQSLRRFACALKHAFQLRAELRELASGETLVCRCEDVPYSRLVEYTTWRAAKLQTRCGMGPCQGRVCGPATEFLFNWTSDSVRPPLFPTRVDSLAGLMRGPEPVHEHVSGE